MQALKIKLTLILSLLCVLVFGQNNVLLEGYVFAKNNRGLVRGAEVKILDHITNELEIKMATGMEGAFAVTVPKGRKYRVVVHHKNYIDAEEIVSTIGLKNAKKVFVKIEMEHKPGYVFDVTMSESRDNGTALLNSIDSARIEVYNNTTRKEELVLLEHPIPVFNFFFEKGNHYTIMIRKKGYFNKRIEAYVDVDSCILCFEGLSMTGVSEMMTDGNKMGTFLANIEMELIMINKTYAIEDIYYNFDKWNIRPDAAAELDKLKTILKDNQHIIVELGSHTDARGNDDYNLTLSEKRAKAAAEYLAATEGIDLERLQAKGYGEEQLVNRCTNGVNCTEREHQRNRRTALKIIGTVEVDPLDKKSLKELIEADQVKQLMSKKTNQEKIVKTKRTD
jgi:outer membrane protein OmpA-like peptidoglycan-associated protein